MKHFPASKIFNVITNLAYPIAGWYGDWFTFIGGILLCIGSSWMHWEHEYKGERSKASIYADWIGMYAFFLAILAHFTNATVMLLIFTFIGMRDGMRDQKLIGLVVLMGVVITQAWWALVAFIPAVIIRAEWEESPYQDYSHAVWHLLTGYGAFLILTHGV